MSDIALCLNAVSPLVFLMSIGFIFKKIGIVSEGNTPVMNRLTFRVFFPFMLFNSIYTSDFSLAEGGGYLLFVAAGTLALFFLAVIFVMVDSKDDLKRGVLIQGIFRNNSTAAGLAVATALFPGVDLGCIAIAIAVTVPLMNVLAVITLVLFSGKKSTVKSTALTIIKNPLIIASLFGILFQVTGLSLPGVIAKPISQMAAVGPPLGLFALGTFFKFDDVLSYKKDLLHVLIMRLIVAPALTITAAALLGYSGVEIVGVLVLFGCGTAITSFAMTQEMGGDDRLAASVVIMTNVLSPFSLFIWLYIMTQLHLF